MVHEDCIANYITTTNPLPQWYLLERDGDIIGCAGLITNDFISRMVLVVVVLGHCKCQSLSETVCVQANISSELEGKI